MKQPAEKTLEAKVVSPYPTGKAMQLIPNYPPYALPTIHRLGGTAVFTGNLAQAIAATASADKVLACEIDPSVVDFYERTRDMIGRTDEFADFKGKFQSMIEGVKLTEGRAVQMGALENAGFPFGQEIYDLVRGNLNNVNMTAGEATDFLARLKEQGIKANVVDLNNVPEYFGNWERVMGNLPIKQDGVLFFGKRDNTLIKENGALNPGTNVTDKPRVPVMDGLKSIGFQPYETVIITNATGTTSGIDYKIERTKGVSRIAIFEERFKSSGVARITGSYHYLFTTQFQPKR